MVGVAGAPRPRKDLGRPFDLIFDARGVVADGGTASEFEVRVSSVQGVVHESVGDGGKTNRVCAGVADGGGICWCAFFEGCLLEEKEGIRSSSLWVSERDREIWRISDTGVTGEGGTGGRRPNRGGGRLFGLDLGFDRLKDVAIAVAGTAGSSKEDL